MAPANRKYGIIDKSRFPAIVVTLTPIAPTSEEFQEHLDELSELIREHKDFFLVLDLSQSKFLSSDARIKAGNWLKSETANMKERVSGLIFVNNSMLMSMMLKGVFLISKPPINHTVVNTLDEALKWIRQREKSLA